MLGRRRAVEQPAEGRQEVVGDGAAQAAIRQFDDVAGTAGGVAAAEQQLAVDPQLAEFVDQDGEPPPLRPGQEVAHQARLAGAEKAGDYRCRNPPHRVSPLSGPGAGRRR